MGISGHLLDAQFAEGFLAGFAVSEEGIKIATGTDGHWRPKANLGEPFGKVSGDVGCTCLLRGADGETLLIVEREGSAPGNERNILKWFRVVETGTDIWLDNGAQRTGCDPESILVILAFGRPANWSQSDFDKTVGFCELLAETVNRVQSGRDTRLTVNVEKVDATVEDWRQAGREIGDRVLSRLKRRSAAGGVEAEP